MLPHLDYKKVKLKNGIRVITIPMKSTAAVTSLVLVGVGGNYESKELSGVSHYLEHLVFKGSKKYPTAQKISTILDSLGASYNATTSKEDTGFYVKTSTNNTEKGLDVIADYLKNPIFKPSEVERERGPIIEEIKMHYDKLDRYAYELFYKIMYNDQPVGRDVVGEEKSVFNIKRADIKKHFDKYYKGENIVVVFAGKITHTQGKKLAEKYFNDVKNGKRVKKPPVILPKPKTNNRILIKDKKSDQSHLVLGFKSLTATDERRFVMAVLSGIMGSGMSSRLFTEVREKRGLAYYVNAGNSSGSDFGHFVATAGMAHNNLEKVLHVIIKELKKIKKQAPSNQEIKKIQDRLEGLTALAMEQSNFLAFGLGTSEIDYNKLDDPIEEIKQIKKVRPSEVRELANDIFKKEMARLSIISSYKNKKELEKILDTI